MKGPKPTAPQAVLIAAVATAAVSLVAGLGTYLFVRFTQGRGDSPSVKKSGTP